MNHFAKHNGGMNIEPQVGAYVVPAEWGTGELLKSCDDWDQADYRIKTIGGDLAVNVEVTGHTLQHPYGVWFGAYVRVKITFVADKCPDMYTGKMIGEDVIVRGWMSVDTAKLSY